MTPILLKPIITERSLRQAGLGFFTFEVVKNANKNTIAREVARQFNVHPEEINTRIVKGKLKRSNRQRRLVARSDWKKAIVKLPKGEKIDLFEIGGTQNA